MTYCFQFGGPAVGPAGGPGGGHFDFLVRKKYKRNKNLSVRGNRSLGGAIALENRSTRSVSIRVCVCACVCAGVRVEAEDGASACTQCARKKVVVLPLFP